MSGISFPADLVPQIHPIHTFNETIVKTRLHVVTGNWQWLQNLPKAILGQDEILG